MLYLSIDEKNKQIASNESSNTMQSNNVVMTLILYINGNPSINPMQSIDKSMASEEQTTASNP